MIGGLRLALQVLLVLGGGLGSLEAKLPTSARVSGFDAVKVFGKLVVLGFGLLGEPLGFLDLVLGGEALLFPRLSICVHLVGELQQILMHSMQGEAELSAVVGDALVGMEDLLELRLVAFMARVWLAYTVEGQAAQLLEAASMLLLKGASTLEEVGKVLRAGLAWPCWQVLGGTDSGTRDAGLEAVEQRSHADIRVQDIVHSPLCLRILRRRSLLG